MQPPPNVANRSSSSEQAPKKEKTTGPTISSATIPSAAVSLPLIILCDKLPLIPSELQDEVLKILYAVYLEVTTVVYRAAQSLWWPGMSADIIRTHDSYGNSTFNAKMEQLNMAKRHSKAKQNILQVMLRDTQESGCCHREKQRPTLLVQ